MGATYALVLSGIWLLSLWDRGDARPHTDSHEQWQNPAVAREHVDSMICRNPVSPFDYSAKRRRDEDAPVCEAQRHVPALRERQSQTDDDFSCSEAKPCRNGACCSKKTGYCNYGPEACGTNGHSPNNVCWSNCDAHAECGKYAQPPGQKCPLNVCCSPFGFCGMTAEFCGKGTKNKPGCQSNCDQPGSGASGGNVQNRVIGYYEAWAHDRKCQGMDFNSIPAGALTHLYFSFGYISPGAFEVVPMDDLNEDLFTKFTNVKRRNSGLKTCVALGGWTFNDNGTATQPVFSDMVSSKANRATFIKNLFSFLRQYAFDGVDFDWEYPGASDRGGHPDDGKNFVTFLKELDDENNKQPMRYVVSFTVPTSFWYLRHFDLTAVEHVDFINVMSYDLHGVWDSTNPIGSHVYAHTNVSEIQLAMDLFWRNHVPPAKLNLGLGFYGRSFQLSDPSCHAPGCNFKGGAAPGGCSANSGTLTYREIQQIIKSHQLRPYHDQAAAVKYITWNQDQWVSFDDHDTFRAKIDFANHLGLGGLLIWAVDQDTDDLEAMKAVLAPKTISAFAKDADDRSYWDDATVPDCYVTDCGGACKAGFFKIENQPCGGAKPVTRHSDQKDSLLCCPLAGAPDPKDCTWRGDAWLCNGHCHDDEVTMQLNRWGDGKYCEDGNKAYCCQSPKGKENKCYWTGVGARCHGDDTTMTFSGTFVSTVADIARIVELIGAALADFLDVADMELQKRYCCPKKDAQRWTGCKWYGEPGSCFNDHCPTTGHSVQLTDSPYGLGQSCFPRLERTRVYCCDPTGGKSPFLPVPLERLFPQPPQGDNVDNDYELNVDDTFGSGKVKTAEEPSDASFQFVVLSSPEELQISLDKRDGSHWEVFNCQDGESEDEHTVQMVCTDVSDDSNCYKIGLGHGVPGTILQMPSGCGPGKYAVAKSMTPSGLDVPAHLRKRLINPVVYDLTFDYDFTRVRRDLGDTQMRIDFSNREHYWDNVVAAAASGKRGSKRSLADVGGNHKRWLEAEWRDDYHFGAVTPDELHKRWFGTDVIDWLNGLINPKITKEFTHDINEIFTAKIVDDSWSCGSGEAKFDGHVLVQALTHVRVSTSFGFTLITKLSLPLDLSQSYLTFSNGGEVTATFTLEALARVRYDTGDREILTLPFPGAAFRVPGIVTIGPSVRVVGSFDASLTLSAEIETKIDIASWEVELTLPAASQAFNPDENDLVDTRNTGNMNGLQQPTFYAAVKAEGKVEAHLKAAMEFGVRFDDRWKVGAAAAAVVADGYIRFKVGAGVSTTGSCPWTYGMDLGVALYAQAEAPPALGWGTKKWNLPGSGEIPLIKGGACPQLAQGSRERRSISAGGGTFDFDENELGATLIRYGGRRNSSLHQLGKRAAVYGPPFKIPLQNLFCPDPNSDSSSDSTKCEAIHGGWDDNPLSKRDLGRSLPDVHTLDKRDRDRKPPKAFCSGSGVMNMKAPIHDTASSLLNVVHNAFTYGYTNRQNCNDFGFGPLQPAGQGGTNRYATEHILEFQLVGIFFDEIKNQVQCPDPTPGAALGRIVNLCGCMKPLWYQLNAATRPTMNVNGQQVSMDPVDWVGSVFPGSDNQWANEFVLLENDVNGAKQGMWGTGAIRNAETMRQYLLQDPNTAIKNLKDTITAIRYHSDPTISARLVLQKDRVGAMLQQMDTQVVPGIVKTDRSGTRFGPWQPQGLQQRWNAWMRGRATYALNKAVVHVDTWLPQLEQAYATPALNDVANRGGNDPEAVTARARILRITTLRNQWTNNRPVWNNPF